MNGASIAREKVSWGPRRGERREEEVARGEGKNLD